jgi:hypothetical protein
MLLGLYLDSGQKYLHMNKICENRLCVIYSFHSQLSIWNIWKQIPEKSRCKKSQNFCGGRSEKNILVVKTKVQPKMVTNTNVLLGQIKGFDYSFHRWFSHYFGEHKYAKPNQQIILLYIKPWQNTTLCFKSFYDGLISWKTMSTVLCRRSLKLYLDRSLRNCKNDNKEEAEPPQETSKILAESNLWISLPFDYGRPVKCYIYASYLWTSRSVTRTRHRI